MSTTSAPRVVRVHLLPMLVDPSELAGGTAVVIDVLRASTTMIQALSSGARAVVPCASIAEARQQGERYPAETHLFGGERHGVTIEGFDLDNSPYSYSREQVQNKTIVFTTTNGTVALQRSEQAAAIVVGAFVNLTAVANWLTQHPGPVHLMCAGTDGQVTAEDVLFAGVLANRLLGNNLTGLDVSTEMASLYAREHGQTVSEILSALRSGLGGQNLVELGYDRDIEFAARVDTLPVVPVWHRELNELRVGH